jgi:hypothetical protein
MKLRHVFSTPDIETARNVMTAAHDAGIVSNDILLAARSDIELDELPNEHKEADTDLIPPLCAAPGMAVPLVCWPDWRPSCSRPLA